MKFEYWTIGIFAVLLLMMTGTAAHLNRLYEEKKNECKLKEEKINFLQTEIMRFSGDCYDCEDHDK